MPFPSAANPQLDLRLPLQHIGRAIMHRQTPTHMPAPYVFMLWCVKQFPAYFPALPARYLYHFIPALHRRPTNPMPANQPPVPVTCRRHAARQILIWLPRHARGGEGVTRSLTAFHRRREHPHAGKGERDIEVWEFLAVVVEDGARLLFRMLSSMRALYCRAKKSSSR